MLRNSFNKLFIQCFFVVTLLLIGSDVMSLEQPKYKVINEQGGIEFRQYESYLVTETIIENENDYKGAAKEGFRRLFSYISGNNATQSDVNMTAPVKQVKSSQKISMTVPVQSVRQTDGYRVSFVLPSQYTMDTAPVPLDSRIRTVQVPEQTVAVIRYSGRWTSKNFERNKQQLLEGLHEKGIKTEGEVHSAFYNAPFILPLFRHNEVMVTVHDHPSNSKSEGVVSSF